MMSLCHIIQNTNLCFSMLLVSKQNSNFDQINFSFIFQRMKKAIEVFIRDIERFVCLVYDNKECVLLFNRTKSYNFPFFIFVFELFFFLSELALFITNFV